jgi:agmatine/peptidylarginine deiminase
MNLSRIDMKKFLKDKMIDIKQFLKDKIHLNRNKLEGNYVLPEDSGEIKNLVMTADSYSLSDEEYVGALVTFLRNLNPNSKITIISPLSKDQIKEYIIDSKLISKEELNNLEYKLNPIQVNYSPTIWARDFLQVFVNYQQNKEDITTAKPNRNPGYETRPDKQVAKTLSENLGTKYEELKGFPMDGGNTIATKNHLFLGMYALKEAKEHYNQDPNEIVKMLMKRFPNQKLIIIGKEKQPAFHIDMFLSILKDNDNEKVAALADLDLTIELINKLFSDNEKIYGHYTKEKIIKNLEDYKKTYFDELKDIEFKLKQEGFKVKKMPFIPLYVNDKDCLTYNNMLLDGNKIYLPSYGIPKLEEKVKKILEEEGFEVVFINWKKNIRLLGAIHCITNVIDRWDNELENNKSLNA